MKKFEILSELPKYDAKTQGEQVLVEKQGQQTCSVQGCHKPLTYKTKYLQIAMKQTTVKQGVPGYTKSCYCMLIIILPQL